MRGSRFVNVLTANYDCINKVNHMSVIAADI